MKKKGTCTIKRKILTFLKRYYIKEMIPISRAFSRFVSIGYNILFLGIFSQTLLYACNDYDPLKGDPLVPKKSIFLSKYIPYPYDFQSWAVTYPQVDYPALQELCKNINLSSKSIAYIGGSLASRPESNVVKGLMQSLFKCNNIYTYGYGGYGFSTPNGSFQNIVCQCNPHDIYILWCSTNDYGFGVPVGEPTDYTEADGYNPSKLSTQCGGINYCIRYLRQLNPDALLIAFSSLPFFGENGIRSDGYLPHPDKDNGQGITFKEYIDKQIECFEKNKIPCLNQWDANLFTLETFRDYFLADGYHMNEKGYFLAGCKQAEFIARLLN